MNASSSHSAASRPGLTLLLIVFGVFLVNLDGTIVNVALPDIQASFGVGLRDLQWITDAYLLTFGCLQLAAGTIGDSIGHRRLFIWGVIGFTLFSFACAVSGEIGWLLAARALQGIFGAILIPVSLAMIRSLYEDPGRRAKAIGLWAGVGGVALAAGPVLGGWLVEAYGWESIFWINLPIGAIIAVALLATKSEDRPPAQRRRLDIGGQLGFVAFIAFLAYGLIEGNARGWDSALIIGAFAASAVSLTAFIVWELRAREPMFPLRLFRNPVMTAAALVNFLGFFGLYAAIFLLTLFWQQAEGLSPIQTGVRFLSLTASIMVFSYLGSAWAPKFAPRLAIPLGSFVIAAALGGLMLLHADDSYVSYAWALALLGFGVSIVGTSATVAVMGAVTPERAGAASGIVSTSRQTSAIFGVALAGAILASHIDASVPGMSIEDSRLLFEEGMHRTMAVSAAASAAGGAIIALLLQIAARRKKAAATNDASLSGADPMTQPSAPN